MSAYSDAVLADGPSFLVACDEVAGTQTNLAGGTGLLNPGGANAPTFQVSSSPFSIPGEDALCIYTDGSATRFVYGTGSDYHLGGGDFSLEAWFAWDSGAGDYKTIMRSDGSVSGYYLLRLTPSGALEGGCGALVTAASNVAQDTWYHGVFVRSGSTGYLYLNGVQVATAGGQVNLSGNADMIVLCAPGSGSERYIGGVQWLAGYKRALTEGEVLQHYRIGAGIDTDDRYPFLGGIVAGGRQHPTRHRRRRGGTIEGCPPRSSQRSASRTPTLSYSAS